MGRSTPQEPTAAALGRTGWGATFASLGNADFRLLWATTLFSSAGNWIQQITLSWLAWDVTQDAVKVALVLGARTLPMFMSPFAGALADRFDRKRLLVVDHILMVVIALAFAVDVLLGRLQEWHMYVFALSSGLTWSMNNPVRQSLVANSVPRELLTNAIALNSMAFNSMRMIGPMIGGGLILFFGPGWNFMLQALMYVGVLIAIFPYKAKYRAASPETRPSFFRGLGEGFAFVARSPVAMSAMAMSFILTFTMMGFITSQLAIFADVELGMPEGGSLGLLYTGMGLGGFIGTILIARFSNFRRKGLLVLFGGLGAGLTMLVLSRIDTLWLATFVLSVQQMFFLTVMMTNNTIIQSTTPDEIRGRAMGVYMLNIAFSPFGGVIAGFITDATSVSTSWAVGAAIGLMAVAVVAVAAPQFRKLQV